MSWLCVIEAKEKYCLILCLGLVKVESLALEKYILRVSWLWQKLASLFSASLFMWVKRENRALLVQRPAIKPRTKR